MFPVSVWLYAPLITCAINTTVTLLPYDFTLVGLMAALSTSVAIMSGLVYSYEFETPNERIHHRHKTHQE